ncbi:MAG: hypothetical protein SNI70_07650 [Rikenellaceae bacterium]
MRKGTTRNPADDKPRAIEFTRIAEVRRKKAKPTIQEYINCAARNS